MIMPGEHKHEPIAAIKIWGHLWRAFRDQKLCYGFYEHQEWLSADGWMGAIREAIRRGVKPNSIKYLEVIGYDIEDNGEKELKPAQRAQTGSVPYVSKAVVPSPSPTAGAAEPDDDPEKTAAALAEIKSTILKQRREA